MLNGIVSQDETAEFLDQASRLALLASVSMFAFSIAALVALLTGGW